MIRRWARASAALAMLALVLATGGAAIRPVSSATTAAVAATATPVFADGFESGTLAAWELSQGLQPVQWGDPFSGAWWASAAAVDGAAFAATSLDAPVADGVASLAFKVHDLTSRATLMKLKAADGTTITVGLNLRGAPFAFMASDEVTLNTAQPVSPDAWHELTVEFHTGATTTALVAIDGVEVREVVSSVGVSPIERLAIGTRREDRTFDLGFDAVSLVGAGDAPDPGSPVIAAAGDIACDPADPSFNGGAGTDRACRMADTAELLTGADVVLPLGDIQYENGALELYEASYTPTWGRFLAVTRPVVGNHEYEQPDASAYFSYFGAAAGMAGRGWYSYDVGAWHLVALNSQCDVVGCGPGSAQYAWLEEDLASDGASCTLAYWHAARFSSGGHGSNPATAPLWELLDADGAEVVLSGHDHHYERFAPQDATGERRASGIRAFVVGTGGKSLNQIEGTAAANSQVRIDDTFGVLKLSLDPAGYEWRFVPVAGSTSTDRGTDLCH